MSFTKEELERAGWCGRFGLDESEAWEPYRDGEAPTRHRQDALLRLALAHPERAALALGEGWSVAPRAKIATFSLIVDGWNTVCSITAFGDSREVALDIITDDNESGVARVWPLPPEFDSGLSRARRVDAALRRIKVQNGADL